MDAETILNALPQTVLTDGENTVTLVKQIWGNFGNLGWLVNKGGDTEMRFMDVRDLRNYRPA